MSAPEPLFGIDDLPWSRLVHFFGRATTIPDEIRDLASDRYAEAQKELRGCLEHQDGVIQATPFAVRFIVRMLNANAVRDPEGVRGMLAVIQAGARNQLQSWQNANATLNWTELLANERLWPAFTSERDDEIQWEEWQPAPEEWISWAMLTDQIITKGLG